MSKIKEYGSEFSLSSNIEYYKNVKQNDLLINSGYYTTYFKSGRDSLKYIANVVKGKRVLFPSIYCDSMLKPFLSLEYEIVFYEYLDFNKFDYNEIESQIINCDIFVFHNFFGIKLFDEGQIRLLKENNKNVIFVYDATHDFYFNKQYYYDYKVISIRKWFSLPDGGVLYSKNKIYDLEIDQYFFNLRLLAIKLKDDYFENGNIQTKLKYRKLLQQASSYLDNDTSVSRISDFSLDIINKINMNLILEKRTKNHGYLRNKILSEKNVNDAVKILSNAESTLYMPIFVKDRDLIQKKLANHFIYAPVIWPIPALIKMKSKIAEYVSDQILCLPCDQRYNLEDMDYVFNVLRLIIGEINYEKNNDIGN